MDSDLRSKWNALFVCIAKSFNLTEREMFCITFLIKKYVETYGWNDNSELSSVFDLIIPIIQRGADFISDPNWLVNKVLLCECHKIKKQVNGLRDKMIPLIIDNKKEIEWFRAIKKYSLWQCNYYGKYNRISEYFHYLMAIGYDTHMYSPDDIKKACGELINWRGPQTELLVPLKRQVARHCFQRKNNELYEIMNMFGMNKNLWK